MATAQEILDWVAKTSWQAAHDDACPQEQIPTLADLLTFKPDADAMSELNRRMDLVFAACPEEMRGNAEILGMVLLGHTLKHGVDDMVRALAPRDATPEEIPGWLLEASHHAWMRARTPPDREELPHFFQPIVKAWQERRERGQRETMKSLARRQVRVLPCGDDRLLARSPALLDLGCLTAIEVDGVPVATRAPNPYLVTYRKHSRTADQLSLFPKVGPETLNGKPVGDIIIHALSQFPLIGDERNPLRGDVYRLGLFVYAISGGVVIPPDLGAMFLTGNDTLAARRRWWATLDTLRVLRISINAVDGEFRDLAIASIGQNGEVYLAPPAWWNGKAWRLAGGLFRPALIGKKHKHGTSQGFWGGLQRTLAGMEAMLSRGPTVGRGEYGSVSRFLRPANGKTGPGPEVFVSARHVLTLAGEYVDLSKPLSNTAKRRWQRRRDALENVSEDTVEVIRILSSGHKGQEAGLYIRATERFVAAQKKALDSDNFVQLPASKVFEMLV